MLRNTDCEYVKKYGGSQVTTSSLECAVSRLTLLIEYLNGEWLRIDRHFLPHIIRNKKWMHI